MTTLVARNKIFRQILGCSGDGFLSVKKKLNGLQIFM